MPSQYIFNRYIDKALEVGTSEGVKFDRVNVFVHYVTSNSVNVERISKNSAQ